MLKNNKGITIVALIITVVILAIIAGTVTYTGINVYQDAKEETVIQELQIIQNAVNNEYNKIISGDLSYIYWGTDVTADNEAIPEGKTYVGYKELTPQELKQNLGINTIDQTVYINFLTKDVRTKNPIGKNESNEDIYGLSQLGKFNVVEKKEELIDEYVQDGLVLHLDGIRNNGKNNEHSMNTTVWKDLSGNGNDATIKSPTWSNNGIYNNNKGIEFSLNNTIELIGKDKDESGNIVNGNTVNIFFYTEEVNIERNKYGVIFNGGAHSLGIMWLRGQVSSMLWYNYGLQQQYDLQGGNLIYIKDEDNKGEFIVTDNKYYNYNFVYKENEEATKFYKKIYLNGRKAPLSNKIDILEGGNNTIPAESQKNGQYYKADRTVQKNNILGNSYMKAYIHGVRIYNRELTPEEIWHNYCIDALRYNITNNI